MSDRTQPYFFLAILLGAFVLTFFIFQPFLAPLSLAVVFAVVLHPLYLRLARLFKNKDSLAALATVCISIVILLIPTIVLGVQLLKEAQQLYGSLSENNGATITRTFEALVPLAEQYVPGSSERISEFSASLDTYSQQVLTWIIQHLGAAFSSIAAIVLDFFIFFIALYYLLRDGDGLRTRLIHLSPLNDRDDTVISNRLGQAVNSVVKGRLAIALAQGALTGIGFAMFGVPNPVLWGLVAAIASIVPPIGTALVVAPGALFLFATGHSGAGIGLAVWGTVAVGSIDNILGPLLMSAGMQLHPLLVLLSLLGGLVFFGPIGIFLGPLTLSLLLVLLSIYTDMSKRSGAAESSVLQ